MVVEHDGNRVFAGGRELGSSPSALLTRQVCFELCAFCDSVLASIVVVTI